MFQFGNRHACRDGDDQVPPGQEGADFLQQFADVRGFDRHDDHTRMFDNVDIGDGGFGTCVLGECHARARHRIAGANLRGCDQTGGGDSFGQSRRHFARTEESDGKFYSHASVSNSLGACAKGIFWENASHAGEVGK